MTRSMGRRAGLSGLCLAAAAGLAGAQPGEAPKPDAPPAKVAEPEAPVVPAVVPEAVEVGATLKVGSKAPGFKVAKWIKGEAVTEFAADRIYVVEFWATWCGPCKRSIPHLTELAAKMKDRVTVVGVSVWETPPDDTKTEYLPKVEAFVTKMGDKMNYVVAADTAEHDMANLWMAASGQQGIPASFIVKDGVIQWIGHPLDGMDAALDEIVAGSYDPKKEAERKAKADEAMKVKQELFQKVTTLAEGGDGKAAVAELDKLIAIEEVAEDRRFLNRFKFDLVLGYDEPAAYAMGRELAGSVLKDDEFNQYVMAERILTDETLKAPDYALALALAERSAAIWKDDNTMALDVVGYAHFKLGHIDQAIVVQEEVLKKLGTMEEPDQGFVTHVNENMELYRKAKAGGGAVPPGK